MAASILRITFYPLIILHLCTCLPTPLDNGKDPQEKSEERLVAEIVKDIVAKVANTHHQTPEMNNATDSTVPATVDVEVFPAQAIVPSVFNVTLNATDFNETHAHEEDDYENDDDDDEDDDDGEEDEPRIPLPSLDPGSEYVLKVFEKLQKGNSMETATKELTTKLSREHR